MIQKIYLILILAFFILAFAVKNISVYISTRQSIKGKSARLTLSIAASSAIYILILLRLTLLDSRQILELNVLQNNLSATAGIILVTTGFIVGILALTGLKNSWRVGIKYDQKTELKTGGIYRISRNPYFLSYHILILGYILIFPSLILMALYVTLAATFHSMILEEEKYLQSVHGENYLAYKKKTGRYL